MSARPLSMPLEERVAQPDDLLLRTLMDSLFDGVVIIDQSNAIQAANPAVETIFGYSAAKLIGRDASVLVPLDQVCESEQFDPSEAASAAGGKELVGRRADGAPFPMAVNLSETTLDGERARVVVFRDLTEREQAEKRIRELALRDPLTGLANRELFHRRLEEIVRGTGRRGRLVALMLLNLDGLKSINDCFGHSVGDSLLRHVAERLEGVTRKGDIVARLGGDEFGVVMVDLQRPEAIRSLAERILESLAEPLTLDGCLINTGAGIGISFFPHDDTNPDELIRKADIALDEAKSSGRNTYQLYESVMNAQARDAKVLESDLRLALVRQEFELHYQPKLCIDACEVVGAEALIRWRHPRRGMVSPSEFIPIAESSDLMVPLGEWVLQAACEQAKTWQDGGIPPLPVAVNISARQFQDNDFVGSLKGILYDTGLEPRWLELEITEGMMMDDTEQTIERFHRIHELGVEISIDDFGTGYSSLAYLKRFPVHRLKIDRSFVSDLTTDTDDAAITEAVIKMGHSLKLKVIAEGVETEQQMAYLRSKGCDELQGFLFSPPLPAEEFLRWLTNWRGYHAA